MADESEVCVWLSEDKKISRSLQQKQQQSEKDDNDDENYYYNFYSGGDNHDGDGDNYDGDNFDVDNCDGDGEEGRWRVYDADGHLIIFLLKDSSGSYKRKF